MNCGRIAVLAVVGWYLLEPPFALKQGGGFIAKTDAPISQWFQFMSFDNAETCEIARRLRVEAAKNAEAQGGNKVVAAIGQYCRCVASDDPRLVK